MTDTLLQLAERCEQATGPDRRLDVLIEIALTPDRQWIIGEKLGRWPREPIYGPLSSLWVWASDPTKTPPEINARQFTASIDAAMTLVPEGCDSYSLLKWPRDEGPSFKASVSWTDVTRHKKPRPYTQHQPRVRRAEAATPALALCAASLRARAAQGGEQ